MPITRREFCQSTATLALATALLGVTSLPPFPPEAAAAETVPAGELMKPDALPEMAMGDDKAPVTVIEYASMTCPHCAHFQETTFPELKKRYIDTGKVRYIFREFPLDNLAAAAFMLARCAGKDDKDKYFALIDTLFRQQRQWAVEKPIPPLLSIAKQAGFTNRLSIPVSRISRCLMASKACVSAPSTSSRCNRHPHSSSMGRHTRVPCRSRIWPRRSTPISRVDKGFLAWRTPWPSHLWHPNFLPGAGKVWKTVSGFCTAVALGGAAIHSPDPCGVWVPRPGPSPGTAC